MKDIRISHQSGSVVGKIQVTGAKSESNRMLILQALFPQIELINLSNSGKALGYLKGTRFLVRNLVLSLSLADPLMAEAGNKSKIDIAS